MVPCCRDPVGPGHLLDAAGGWEGGWCLGTRGRGAVGCMCVREARQAGGWERGRGWGMGEGGDVWGHPPSCALWQVQLVAYYHREYEGLGSVNPANLETLENSGMETLEWKP